MSVSGDSFGDVNVTDAEKLRKAESRIRLLESALTSMRMLQANTVDAKDYCEPEFESDALINERSRFIPADDCVLSPEVAICSSFVKPVYRGPHVASVAQLVGPLASDSTGVRSQSGAFCSGLQSDGNLCPERKSSEFGPSTSSCLPKRELITFDGDPARYWMFMRCFEANVSRTTSDPTIRLSYLIQYCCGEAKEAIESCLILDPGEGFEEAMNILRRRFGRPHMIARTHINALTDGPNIRPNDFTALSRLAVELRSCYLTLKQLRYESDLNASRTISSIVRRLPNHLQFKWAEHAARVIRTEREPNFIDLTDFVDETADVVDTYLSFAARPCGLPAITDRGRSLNSRGYAACLNIAASSERNFPKCLSCEQRHYLDQCDDFRNLSLNKRLEFCRAHRLCQLCLKPNHDLLNCRSRRCCGSNNCKLLHHPLLHVERSNFGTPTTEGSSFALSHIERSVVSLGLLPVLVSGPAGTIRTLALIDNGSDTSLIDSTLLQVIGVQGSVTTLNISTVAGRCQVESQLVSVTVRSIDGDEAVQLDSIRSVSRLPEKLGTRNRNNDFDRWSHLSDLQLPELEGRVELLIGCDNPYLHWVLDQRRGDPDDPYAVKTPLGWIVLGPNKQHEIMRDQSTSLKVDRTRRINSLRCDSADLHQLLEQMYEREFDGLDSPRLAMSVNDRRALRLMEASKRKVGTHYEIALPWQAGRPRLPDNRQFALMRLAMLKKRLLKNAALRQAYTKAVEEYIFRGYAELAPVQEQQIKGETWYIPHHSVSHPRKPGKVRVVFDCQASYRGTSLNQQLLSGPDMSNSLVGTLLRFRFHPIAVASDIEAMFHQVKVPIKDRNCLRFLWWKNGNLCSPPIEYRMTVHPFGATSSPSCANFALRQAILDSDCESQTKTKEVAENCFYVDDCLFSVDSVPEATELVIHLTRILSDGGFHLTKWISNRKEVIAHLPDCELKVPGIRYSTGEDCVTTALGLNWNVTQDHLTFLLEGFNKTLTRRAILSFIASVYDPLGLIAPVLLPAKLLLQSFVKRKLDWDEPLPAEDQQAWSKWLSNANGLNNLSVERCINPFGCSVSSVQLHCFSDASEAGYGAALYLRCEAHEGKVSSSLIISKSRVSPIRTVSIPRLELTAAVLNVRMSAKVIEEMALHCSTTFWTDSMVVLKLLRSVNGRFPTYVANRITTIQQYSHPSQWRYVNSKQNPADIASRGLSTSLKKEIHQWLHGPQFLVQPPSSWPMYPENLGELPLEWLRPEVGHVFLVTLEEHWINKFKACPTWTSLRKYFVTLLRFKSYFVAKYLRRAAPDQPAKIESAEIRQATLQIVKLVQSEAFAEEMRLLAYNEPDIPVRNLKSRSCRLRRLKPFLINGILRVGGRLDQLSVPYDARHPILLPGRHFVTRLLILHYHYINGHSGAQHTLYDLQRRYWILGGLSSIRHLLFKCAKCRVNHAKPLSQLMAPVITDQCLTYQPAFTAVGIDYFGPLIVKRGRVHEKRYGCLFSCLTTRAVHIEVSHSMDTDSFLCAFSRFSARRGWPTVIYSDNGQNFHGAEAELRNLLKQLDQTKITKSMLAREVDWKFNPPCASHRGGLWERLIRSTRELLRNILNGEVVTEEVLVTTLTEIERILNDRPLVAVPDSPDSQDAISPRQLLTLSNDQSLEYPPINLPIKMSRRWRQVRHLSDMFWRRWIRVYLPTLQNRQKWLNEIRDLRQGDLVLVCDLRTSRGLWPKGVVEQVIKSKDQLVRQALVRTSKGILRRDVRQLCLLEAYQEEENDAVEAIVRDRKPPGECKVQKEL
ncbi:unnamed protein product [Dicrocoelium dendriticum]|nr:unnamed protein product [Dicrocoelium dendriticum]